MFLMCQNLFLAFCILFIYKLAAKNWSRIAILLILMKIQDGRHIQWAGTPNFLLVILKDHLNKSQYRNILFYLHPQGEICQLTLGEGVTEGDRSRE